MNYSCTHRASQPSFSQRNFSCARRVWGQSVTERRLWAPLKWAACHHLVPGLCLLAALDLVGCVCVCLGGYLYRRMPPIWGWTAVFINKVQRVSLLELTLKLKKVFPCFHREDGKKLDHLDSSWFCIAASSQHWPSFCISYYLSC